MKKQPATLPIRYITVDGQKPRGIDGEIVEEGLVCISVNGEELATFMCTPSNLEILALGFLYNERIINRLDNIRHIRVSESTTCVDVWLKDMNFTRPSRAIVTSGCGGGVTFDDLSGRHEPLVSSQFAKPEQLAELMQKMLLGADSYKRARGIHTAVLAHEDQVLLQVEDVGRHNCLDKLCGAALKQGIDTKDKLLFSSGRISSEMLNKARRLQTPIVCSRTSPTSLSVALAEAWNMTIVAYIRNKRMRIYTHPERILIPDAV
ncbi:MAG: formate dehydrogenase accessory sulfurtransferase FdhD [Candidatus Promineifilaceae bacterium]|nr:formate dehydrogenase accessory sulfurtransferase FdhD [Candidatus Promineifilaceae bacterium]